MTINELIGKAHAQAKSIGWWDGRRNAGERLMLVVSECGKALVAHRNGRRADMERVGERYASFLETWTMHPPELIDELQTPEEFMMLLFMEHIKDTFEDALADIAIRIADLLGDIGYACEHEPNGMKRDGNVGEALVYVTRMVCKGSPKHLCAAMMEVFGIAEAHNVDLWRHIELKLAWRSAANSERRA